MISELKLFDAIMCDENELVIDVARMLRVNRNRHVFVIDQSKKPVGVISAVDICNRVVAEERNPSRVFAKDIMTTPIDVVESCKEVEHAMKVMMERNIYSCPVVEEGKLQGEVSYRAVNEKIISKINE